jgi:membrane-associated protease RseP (regulator of RpoE activity)
MRIAALASVVVLAPGAPRGCLGSSDAPIEVRWELPEGPGDRGVRFVGCIDWDLASLGEGQDGVVATPGWSRCGVVGWRRDGQLIVQTEPIPLDGDGGDVDVAFDLVSGPIGGMGAAISSTGYGVLVHQVVPGSPADEAGIVPGDLVVDVDGTSTRELTTHAFIRRATGAPGTPVRISVLRDGEPVAIDIERARIP